MLSGSLRVNWIVNSGGGYIQSSSASAGTAHAADKGLHTGDPQAARRDGGDRGQAHVHANARSGEAELHNHHKRLQRCLQPGQDA